MTRTLVAAAEPPERPNGRTSGPATRATANTVIAFMGSIGVTVTPWQATLIHWAYGPDTHLPHRPLR